jgi:hypothetical protein
MDEHIEEFYHSAQESSPHGNFHEVIALHKIPATSYVELLLKTPQLPRGWYELAHLSKRDRLEFVSEFWLSKLPYHPMLTAFIASFFASLDDISIFLVQQKWDDPFYAEMVYSLSNNRGFFRGAIPANDNDLVALQKMFPQYILPRDYLAFLQIHNGFCKATDCTGILPAGNVYPLYSQIHSGLSEQEMITSTANMVVNPKSLIPFYESFGMPFYQCFWGEWYPDQEMGNVYYSLKNKRVSDVRAGKGSPENMAFATFIDWLIFYLEPIS